MIEREQEVAEAIEDAVEDPLIFQVQEINPIADAIVSRLKTLFDDLPKGVVAEYETGVVVEYETDNFSALVRMIKQRLCKRQKDGRHSHGSRWIAKSIRVGVDLAIHTEQGCQSSG